eukprot:TRINITY_DN730_c0_g1_i9.p1 TRINITY_DN730_c0_g1~~TRINITY_DN730_c0_g1_i9.p1  ORF type:complete len:262 (+),score=-24.00 TRINITY_DN730_c0_g1_i9:23-787(+)
MIRRPPRSTPLYSSAASDVYKRQPQNPKTPKPLGSIREYTMHGQYDSHVNCIRLRLIAYSILLQSWFRPDQGCPPPSCLRPPLPRRRPSSLPAASSGSRTGAARPAILFPAAAPSALRVHLSPVPLVSGIPVTTTKLSFTASWTRGLKGRYQKAWQNASQCCRLCTCCLRCCRREAAGSTSCLLTCPSCPPAWRSSPPSSSASQSLPSHTQIPFPPVRVVAPNRSFSFSLASFFSASVNVSSCDISPAFNYIME